VRVAGLARWFAVVELVAVVVFLLALNPFISYRALNPTNRIFFVYPLRDIAPFIIIASVLLLAVFSYLGVLGVKGIDPGRAGRRLVREYMAGCHLVSALSIIEVLLLAVFHLSASLDSGGYPYSDWDILGAVSIALLAAITATGLLTVILLYIIGIRLLTSQTQSSNHKQ